MVADAALVSGRWEKVAFLDDKFTVLRTVLGLPVLAGLEAAAAHIQDYPDLVVAVGNNRLRVELLKKFSGLGFALPPVLHPAATVSRFASLAPGVVVFAGSVVNAGSFVGLGAIINTGVTVDHDCVLGDGAHLSPGVHLAGEVRIGEFSWIGIGASVIQGIAIGADVIVGAGAAVIAPLPDNVTAAGVPARFIKTGGAQ